MVVFHVVLLTDPFGSSAARFRTALQGGQGPDARTQKTEKVTSRTGKRCVKRASGTRGPEWEVASLQGSECRKSPLLSASSLA